MYAFEASARSVKFLFIGNAMMRVALTDRFVSAAKAGDYFDAKTVGLNLRVTPRGVKSWFAVFTSPKNGKRARVRLGHYPQTPLAKARTLALEARGHLEDGRDPRELFAVQARGKLTLGNLVASYLAKHVRPRLRSAPAVERRFNKNVLPIIGNVALADLHKREVNRAIDPIIERGSPIEAARCFEDLRAMFRWAVDRGDLDHSPAEGMRKPGQAKTRDRILSDDEIRLLWIVLPEAVHRSKAVQTIIKLCLVTAQRVGEVAGIHRDELDLKRRLWTIPATRTKNKHKHIVPLSDVAIELLKGTGAGRWIFPNDDGDGPLPGHAVAKTITKAQNRFGLAHWTAHDLRRTAVSNMAALGVKPIVLGHVINHRSVTKAGVTLSVYQHYDYAEEKEEALALWADRLDAIVRDGANVLHFHGAPS
jgi:integrase